MHATHIWKAFFLKLRRRKGIGVQNRRLFGSRRRLAGGFQGRPKGWRKVYMCIIYIQYNVIILLSLSPFRSIRDKKSRYLPFGRYAAFASLVPCYLAGWLDTHGGCEYQIVSKDTSRIKHATAYSYILWLTA